MTDNTYYGMSFERYDYLMDETGPCVRLSDEEIKEGWHFCDEWDGLLIHPDSMEFHSCCCFYMKNFKTPEREKAYQERWNKTNKELDRLADLDEELGLH